MFLKRAQKMALAGVIAAFVTGLGLQGCTAAHSHDHTGGHDDGAQSDSHNVLHISPETRAEIEAVLYDKYLGGQKQGRADLLQSAFNKDAVMLRPTKADDGTVYLRKWTDMHSVAASWAETARPDLDYNDFKILSISAVDERMAVVLFRFNDSVYDGITLAKIGDEWQIAAKVYIKQ